MNSEARNITRCLNFPNKRRSANTGDCTSNISKLIAKGYHTTLLMEGTLNQRLCEIDLEANEMLEVIISRLAIERGIDENLKARDTLRWVAEINNVKANTEEIVLWEVAYV